MSKVISIDPVMVERYLSEFSAIGKYGETGLWRPVYSEAWMVAADQYAAWCEEAGLSVYRDAVGNVWGRHDGSESGPSIVSGSHIDSQLPGGRFDGSLGALAALIALRSLRDQYGRPRHSLEAVAFCEEESSRFPSAQFWGSRAITGRIRDEDLELVRGYNGESIAEAMREAGLDPARYSEARRDDISTFVELHIEQGPILEQADVPVAVVNAITGIRHYVVQLTGIQNHAGAFPMDLRHDPMAAAAEIVSGVIDTAHRIGRPAVTTVGRMLVEPNFPAIIPDSVAFTIDARHPDPVARARLYEMHESLMREVASRRDIDITWHLTTDHAPSTSHPEVVAALEQAARLQGVPSITMPSGAVHDTQQMALIAERTAMVFVRSKDGRSHTPEEYSSLEDIVAGIEVLAAGLYQLAY